MGPILLFDKSTLQSLSVDEAVWFDNFFLTVISPLFYVETLADLEKAIKSGKTPEEEVGLLAVKTPVMGGHPNIFHLQICIADLYGHKYPMDGRPIIPGGRPVNSDGQKGFVFDVSPEAEAFSRWQDGQFLDVERNFARNWRSLLKNIDLIEITNHLKKMNVIYDKCKSLEEAKSLASSIVNNKSRPFELMKLVFFILGIDGRHGQNVMRRFATYNYPPLPEFAPYTSFVLSIELFFHIAIASGLISGVRTSNKVDISYLFYLPFCMVFTSSDKLHKKCAPLFLRSNQEFIWGPDLKKDLSRLNKFFDKMPECEKEKGINSFASDPPKTGDYLVSQLWDRFLPRWRKERDIKTSNGSFNDSGLVEHINKFKDGTPLKKEEVDFDVDSADAVLFKRNLRKKRGNWWQLPKDLPDDNSFE